MLVGLCSVKGSPGVTTAALAMAARWPDGDPVVVEADPAGGDLTARFRLPATPGVVSLAAAARRQSSAELLAEHCQRLPGGLRVVVGPVAAEQARAALGVLTTRGLRALRAAARSPESAVLVDVGRLDAASPALPLVRGADALMVMTRPRADELSHVATLLESVSTWTRTPGLVLIGDGYSRAEVERELGVPVMASLPDDPQGAAVLCGQPRGRTPDRSALGRTAARLGRTLLRHVQTSDTSSDELVTATTPATGNGEVP
ncbi:chromosome partitioning protein [Saccharopolyspora sp. HNM0986]|nr:chromosome partitioning protein [Saccharopolyspora sp. HNM0986]